MTTAPDGGGGGGGEPTDEGTPTPGGEITYGLEAETASGWCLPEAQLAISGIQVARTIYDTLTAPDADGEIKPFLAESVEGNEDSTVWTIKLREGVKFHDGTDARRHGREEQPRRVPRPVSGPRAAAVRLRLPGHRERRRGRPAHGQRDDEAAVGRRSRGSCTAAGALGMMAQAQLDSTSCNDDLIGTGPFMKESWTVNDAFVATKNPDYWGTDADGNQLPYLDQITYKPLEDEQARFNSLQGGEFTAMHTSSSLIIEDIRSEADSGALSNVESQEFGEVNYAMLNSSTAPFDSLTARQVLAYGLNRETINEIRAANIPNLAQGPFAPGNVGYLEDTGYPAYDEQKAKDLIAQYEQETGSPLAFTYTHGGDPEGTATAQLIQELMGDLGVNVSLQPIADQSAVIDAAIGGEFQAVGWRNHPGGDPDTQYVWWYNSATRRRFRNPVNFGRFNDPEINRLLDEGRTTADDARTPADLRGSEQALRRAVVEHLDQRCDLVDRQCNPTCTACSARDSPTAAARSRVSRPGTRCRACG